MKILQIKLNINKKNILKTKRKTDILLEKYTGKISLKYFSDAIFKK